MSWTAFRYKPGLQGAEDIANFPVPLRDGCFGPVVRFPKAWGHWYFQPTGDEPGAWWIAFWPVGKLPSRPLGPNEAYAATLGDFRLQGHGTVMFYSNDVVPK
jgi:hypothetical protein